MLAFIVITSGTEHIIKRLLVRERRSLWILAWEGTKIIAQTLWHLKESYSEAEYQYAFNQIQIYAMADQDTSFF